MPSNARDSILRSRNRDRITTEERRLLDLYCAEILAQGPAGLSLRKLWAPFDPNGRCAPGTRGYYVVQTRGGRVRYRHFGLTELTQARAAYIHAMGEVSYSIGGDNAAPPRSSTHIDERENRSARCSQDIRFQSHERWGAAP